MAGRSHRRVWHRGIHRALDFHCVLTHHATSPGSRSPVFVYQSDRLSGHDRQSIENAEVVVEGGDEPGWMPPGNGGDRRIREAQGGTPLGAKRLEGFHEHLGAGHELDLPGSEQSLGDTHGRRQVQPHSEYGHYFQEDILE